MWRTVIASIFCLAVAQGVALGQWTCDTATPVVLPFGPTTVETMGPAESFDVSDIDVTTLRLGPDEAATKHELTDSWIRNEHLADVNLDGFPALVAHFPTRDTGIACGDDRVGLTAGLSDGSQVYGADSVRTAGCPSNKRSNLKSTKTVKQTATGSPSCRAGS